MCISCQWREAKEVIVLADSLDIAEHVLYNDTMRIDVGSTTLGDIIADVISKNPSLLMYALNAKTGGMWDLKAHYAAGSILYGNVYASPRDAGNFVAGCIAGVNGTIYAYTYRVQYISKRKRTFSV